MKKYRSLTVISILAIIFMLTIMFGSMIVFKLQISKKTNHVTSFELAIYDKYYVMITKDTKSSFWQSVYEEAKKAGEEVNAYVELMGSQLPTEYSRKELLRIAIESDVDGIFLEADESSEMTDLINEAVGKNIPVITVIGDNTASKRQSFVGISSYNLGRVYGSQVIELADEKQMKVLILMTANAKDSGQNLIYLGIQEMLDSMKRSSQIQLENVAIDSTSSFAAEESIRDIFMESEILPDILICLDEINTTCAYQAVVDYNKVGVVNIIGYYDSETILNAIRRSVIYSTISIQTEQIGQFLIEAISEYQEVGQVSEYYTVDTSLITSKNIEEYYGGDNMCNHSCILHSIITISWNT